ncbi:hypothetical protein [Roseomonas sp. HF4]|uniref:hypothetical protein n=1 Tax=Roseomonas sp. HF4 TaxID=2562313 RepID=UPI0010C0BE21|nr:hypothetical protein [Roseomonas sp. HF4]
MSIDVSGVARIRHAENGTVYTVDPDELDWDEVGNEERGMGAEVTHVAVVEHSELGNLNWTVWEYPVGTYNNQQTDVGRHTLLENFEFGVSDPDVAASDREARIQAMVDWFFENFEDPAHRTPYETAEGGYIWIWGGPYDAADEIGSNFSEEDQELIDEAVERVQHDGIFDWAPTEKPGDYEPERDDPEDEPGDGQPPVEDEEEPDGRVSSFEDILATIPPEPSGPLFDRTDQARIDLVDWDGAAAPDGALLSALREQTAELILQLEGTNGHQALLHALIRYSDAVNAVPAPIPRLYIEGVFLENAAAQGDREIVAGDRPPLPGSVPSGLASLHHLHGTLIMSTPTGSAMVEAAERYRATPKDQDRLNQSIKEVAQAIRDTPVVFGPVARQLAEQAASNVGKGERPARSNHAASLLLKRMLAGAGKVVKFAVVAGLLTVVGDGLAATGAGVQAMAAVTALGEAAWSFLVGHVDALRTFAALVGSDLGWLRQLTAWLLSRR